MKFSVASVFASLAVAVSAKPMFTNTGFALTSGKPFTLTWSNADGPVTIVLATGSASDLKKVETIVSSTTSSSFTWTPPTTLVAGSYAFEIFDSSDEVNYSSMFYLTGTGSSSASVSSAPATSASSAASSAVSSAVSSSASGSSTISTSASLTSSFSTISASNHTTTIKSSTSGSTATATTTPKSTVAPANTNNGQAAKSPLALVLVAFAAFVYLN